jgi:hypothetical protein
MRPGDIAGAPPRHGIEVENRSKESFAPVAACGASFMLRHG